VLCYLQGQTNEEAARQLGCAPGTVFSRLARARDRLRSRLESSAEQNATTPVPPGWPERRARA
jgi:DNA-directed RNA polymerase specialized sigma24 family protein